MVIHETADQSAWGGSYLALLDGQAVAHTDTLSQALTIPATCTAATLSFYLHIDTAQQTKRIAYDTLKVTLQSVVDGSVLDTLDTYSNLDAATGYQRYTFDVSGYAGTSLRVTFSGTENSTRQTTFALDRVTLPVS